MSYQLEIAEAIPDPLPSIFQGVCRIKGLKSEFDRSENCSCSEDVLMSGSPKLTFRGITRRIFNHLRKKASKKGIHVLRPSGEAEKDGVKIQWKYDAESEMLEVECVHTPFWIDSAIVNKNLQSEIEATLNHGRAAA